MERQHPDLVLGTHHALLYAARCPSDDQTLETLRGWAFARARVSGAAGSLLREGPGEIDAGRVSLFRILCQRPDQHGVQMREIGSAL
ncbi:hypothetical protein A5745_13635 [Mycobacterium sp. IS-2888]|nr:hypothetical protein A5745_13635 [Mycobacterium sp. IS-2888]